MFVLLPFLTSIWRTETGASGPTNFFDLFLDFYMLYNEFPLYIEFQLPFLGKTFLIHFLHYAMNNKGVLNFLSSRLLPY